MNYLGELWEVGGVEMAVWAGSIAVAVVCGVRGWLRRDRREVVGWATLAAASVAVISYAVAWRMYRDPGEGPERTVRLGLLVAAGAAAVAAGLFLAALWAVVLAARPLKGGRSPRAAPERRPRPPAVRPGA
jgi:hypothetical protein